ncbi:MAG: glycosyltransferase [Acidobacteria bacterium]|uniref:Glycosyltransferase n=1 Tax=Candidatus Polarisedimenticola svalbardensis TaxID=2886004 RepID=A0A8J6Y0B0_9BACT|nr:glycosyltransferase [Candidatus Polarisedimenticola svalbardensis]
MKVTFFQRKPHPQQISIEELFATVRQYLPDDIEPVVHVAPELSKGILSRFRIARAARRSQGDVNHITGDIHFIAMLLDRRRTILTVHDCVPLTRSSGLRRSVLKYFWFILPARYSACVTVISEKTRRELLEHVTIDPDRIVVIPNCVAPEFQPGPDRPIDPACLRILQIGTADHKNLDTVCEAISGIPCTLDIIGTLSERQTALLAHHEIRYETSSGLSREALVAHYHAADIVTFVSKYEGFGMPVIEAQATATPLITSDISPMNEIAGAGACRVNPLDAAAIRTAVTRMVQDAPYRTRIIADGLKNIEQFRPVAIAGEYAELYRRVCSGGFNR